MAGAGVDVGICWLELHNLDLGCGLWYIDEYLVQVVCFCRITGWGHVTSLFVWASPWCVYIVLVSLHPWQYMWCHRCVIV